MHSAQPGSTVARTSQCVIAARENEIDNLSVASEPRPHTELPLIWEDQPFAKLKPLEMFLEFQQPPRLGRSTVRGMSSVMQRDDDDDKEGTQNDAGALQNQIDLLTQSLAEVKDADDKHDF